MSAETSKIKTIESVLSWAKIVVSFNTEFAFSTKISLWVCSNSFTYLKVINLSSYGFNNTTNFMSWNRWV